MKKLQICVQRHISLTPDPESLVDLPLVLFRQRHEALARPLGCPLGTDGTGLGRNIGSTLFSFQKKCRCLQPPLVPSSIGEGSALVLNFRSARNAPYGFVEPAFSQEVKPGDADIFVDGQEHSTGTLSVAPVKISDCCQHSSDRSIMIRVHRFAVCPMMDASTRDSEQITEFLPGQTGSASNFHNGLGRGLRRHMVDLSNRARGSPLGTLRDRCPTGHQVLTICVSCCRSRQGGRDQQDHRIGIPPNPVHGSHRGSRCLRYIVHRDRGHGVPP